MAYYNQDFLYNEQHHRFEMVISKDRTGAGGANPRDIVWRESAKELREYLEEQMGDAAHVQ